jgi:hypothetical protein
LVYDISPLKRVKLKILTVRRVGKIFNLTLKSGEIKKKYTDYLMSKQNNE